MTDSLNNRLAIDVHVHFHPAMAEFMVDVMRANHLSAVVNLGILEWLDMPYEDGMRIFRRALGDSLVYFCTPDFGDMSPGFGERMAADLERKVAAGACGLKIFKELGLRHTDADGRLVPVDDARLDPLWAKAGELGVPVLIHTADPVAFFQPLDQKNERWEELQRHPDWHFGRPEVPGHDTLLTQRNHVIEQHPGTVFIGAHLGNFPESLAYVDDCLDRYPNFFVDTSARIGEIGRHPVERVRAFFARHQDRVLFGTDLVLGWDTFEETGEGTGQERMAELRRFYDAHWRFFETGDSQIEYPGFPVQGRWRVDALGLPAGVLEKLYTLNAQRLIPGLQK